LAFLDDLQGRILARFARETLHARRAAVLYDISTAYSRDIAERFRAEFAALGGTVAAFETYTADQATQFGPQLRRVAAAAPHVLAAGGGAGALDPDSLRDALAATENHQGATGVIGFGGRADPRRAVAVSQLLGHDLRTVSLVEP